MTKQFDELSDKEQSAVKHAVQKAYNEQVKSDYKQYGKPFVEEDRFKRTVTESILAGPKGVENAVREFDEDLKRASENPSFKAAIEMMGKQRESLGGFSGDNNNNLPKLEKSGQGRE